VPSIHRLHGSDWLWPGKCNSFFHVTNTNLTRTPDCERRRHQCGFAKVFDSYVTPQPN
jgi:hypothetical protein